jgi:hypothetical protein
MNNCNETTKTVLSRDSIVERAKEKWDSKPSLEKLRSSHKYKHIFERLKLPSVEWDNEFEKLSKNQINILVKGELIRTYDSMSNKDKTKIKNEFGLSTFSSKWFRLPPCDKKILLNSIIK